MDVTESTPVGGTPCGWPGCTELLAEHARESHEDERHGSRGLGVALILAVLVVVGIGVGLVTWAVVVQPQLPAGW